MDKGEELNPIRYITEKIKDIFSPKVSLAPPMPKTRKPRAKSAPAKKTATKKVSKK
jgi:hypothetical protein